MLRSIFERARPFLEPALDGTHSIEDVWKDVSSGVCDLWQSDNAAAVCHVVEHPQLKEYHVWLAGGDLRELIELERGAQDYARELGCKRMTVRGRKGFARLGYTPTHVEMVKEL